jgi:hypothetical protein
MPPPTATSRASRAVRYWRLRHEMSVKSPNWGKKLLSHNDYLPQKGENRFFSR